MSSSLSNASGLPPSTIVGTAIVTEIGTGLLGSAVYLRSGQLREPLTRRTALILSGSAVLGTPLGVLVNSAVSGRAFGISLGVLVAMLALVVWWRERRRDVQAAGQHPRRSTLLIATVGFVIAVAGGLFGIGGPMLTVPVLVAGGTPLLSSLAVAQAQSVVIAGVGTVGYLSQGAVSWPLALLIGLPECCGVLIGWKIAQAIPTRRLKYLLVATLLSLAPYLALHR